MPFLHIGYPSKEREKAILMLKVPSLPEELAAKIADFAAMLRSLDLKKHPSISETLDWAVTLLTLDAKDLDPATVASTLNVLLKYQADVEKARAKLG